jgi:hypothetical protein
MIGVSVNAGDEKRWVRLDIERSKKITAENIASLTRHAIWRATRTKAPAVRFLRGVGL